jgi:hypothetical protein
VDPSSEGAVHELQQRLGQGLFVDNLEPMVDALTVLTTHSEGPRRLAAWTLQSVLADLANLWEDCPLAPKTYQRTNDALRPLAQDIVVAFRDQADSPTLYAVSERLVDCFIELQTAGSIAA